MLFVFCPIILFGINCSGVKVSCLHHICERNLTTKVLWLHRVRWWGSEDSACHRRHYLALCTRRQRSALLKSSLSIADKADRSSNKDRPEGKPGSKCIRHILSIKLCYRLTTEWIQISRTACRTIQRLLTAMQSQFGGFRNHIRLTKSPIAHRVLASRSQSSPMRFWVLKSSPSQLLRLKTQKLYASQRNGSRTSSSWSNSASS